MQTLGASHDWETDMEDTSQMGGHAEMPSIVAERPAPRKKEQMKSRVIDQGLYPCSAWLECCHDSGLIFHKSGFHCIVNQRLEGGMISQIIRCIKFNQSHGA